MNFEVEIIILRHNLGRPSFGELGRLEKKGASITRPRDSSSSSTRRRFEDAQRRRDSDSRSPGHTRGPGPSLSRGSLGRDGMEARSRDFRLSTIWTDGRPGDVLYNIIFCYIAKNTSIAT